MNVWRYTTNQIAVLKTLDESGIITGWDGDYIDGVCNGDWDLAAKALSYVYPRSECWPNKNGVTVQQGSTTIIRLMSPKKYSEGLPVSRMVAELTGKSVPAAGPAAIRRLFTWVGKPQRPNIERDAVLMRGKDYGYNDCKPGKANACTMYDLSSCYFSLLFRLPSLYARVGTDSVQYHPMPESMRNRWQAVGAVGATNREFKETIWGVALGSASDKTFRVWRNGLLIQKTLPPGPFSTAAKLVARMAWELDRDQSEQGGSIYSQTDCVILPSNAKPKIWESYGLLYTAKHSGDCDIVRQHCYKIGEKSTFLYDNMFRLSKVTPKHRPLAKPPEFRYYERVLS